MSSTALSLRLQPTTVPPGPGRPARPQLRVLPGGRAPARLAQAATFRRRRLVVAVLVLALLAGATLLVGAAAAKLAGGAPSSAAGVTASAPAAPATVVVRPGDTLWSIAAAVAPDVDVRVTVDRLVALNGPTPIVPGQQLVLPAA